MVLLGEKQLKKKLFPLVLVLIASMILISTNLTANQNVRLDKILATPLNTLHTIDSDWSTGWTMSAPLGTDIEVLSSYSGEASVLHLNDSSGGNYATAKHSFGKNITFGRVNVKILVALSPGQEVLIGFLSGGASPVEYLRMSLAGDFEVSYSSSFNDLDTPTNYLGGIWYEVGFEVNCSSSTTKTYINGVEKSSDIFESTALYMDGFIISTSASGGPTEQGDYYIAWMDYSWVTVDENPIPGFEFTYIVIGIFVLALLIVAIRIRGQKEILNYF